MDTYTPPKIPVLETIRKMRVRTVVSFTDRSADTVKALVSRVRVKFPNRRYRTSKRGGCVKVWRDA